jgi:K+-dependent Na+/Ca+ exchanger-like protein
MAADNELAEHTPTVLSLLLGACIEGSEDHNGQQWERNGGFLVWMLIILFVFYLIAQLCDGHLSRALDLIVEKLGISEDVAGATFLAMAGSAPELFCSVISVFYLESHSGVGNIVGSALFNLLVIIGVTPAFSEDVLDIWWFPTCRDAFWYGMAILELLWTLRDGFVTPLEAGVMVLTYILYIVGMWKNQAFMNLCGIEPPASWLEDMDESPADKVVNGKIVPAHEDGSNNGTEDGNGNMPDTNGGKDESSPPKPQVPGKAQEAWGSGKNGNENGNNNGRPQASFQNGDEEAGKHHNGVRSSQLGTTSGAVRRLSRANSLVAPTSGKDAARGSNSEITSVLKDIVKESEEEEEEEEAPNPVMCCIDRTVPADDDKVIQLFTIVCLWLLLFTYVMLDCAERVGCIVHVPKVVMGQIVLAAGTSVPDAMGSIVVAKMGKGDMAVANAVGSNTFDILLGLGGPWLAKCLWTGKPLPVPVEALLETVVMLSVCLVGYVLTIKAQGWKLSRGTGVVMLAVYFSCITWILIGSYVKDALGIGNLADLLG